MSENQEPEYSNIPIQSKYKDVPVNGSIRLYEGLMQIETTHATAMGEGTIDLNLQGDPRIQFTTTLDRDVGLHLHEGTLLPLALPNATASPIFIKRQNFAFPRTERNVSGELNYGGLTIHATNITGKKECVGRIQFHLINFREIYGHTLCEGSAQRKVERSGRVHFCMGNWEIILDQFPDMN